MSRLLIEESPLQVLPTLAVRIGLNEAIFLQQLHYWLQVSRNEHDGQTWVWNTIAEWQAQFPFWSTATIKRTAASLREQGLIRSTPNPTRAGDRTNWYTIDYPALDALEAKKSSTGASDQVDPTMGSSCAHPSDQDDPLYAGASGMQETTSQETSSTSRGEDAQGALAVDVPKRPRVVVNRKVVTAQEWAAVEGIIDSFNAVFGTKFGRHAKDNVSKVVMRLREGAPFDVAAHRAVHEANAKAPWWGSGKPDTLGVLYAPKAWPRARVCDGVPRSQAARRSQTDETMAVLDKLANSTDEDLAAMGWEPGRTGSILGGF